MSYFTEPRLSACIVHYDTGVDTMRTVQYFQDSTICLELFVVDNAPCRELAEHLQWQAPAANYIAQKKNLGYGGGNNVVLPYLRSEYHLICNPDVAFSSDLLDYMVQYMDQNPSCVVLTPKVLNPDGSEQFLPKRAPRLRYLIARRFEQLHGPFDRWRDEYTLKNLELTAPAQVEFATGCFMLVRTHAFQRMGGFDTRFFLYHEDSDLSMRAREIGDIVYHPGMVVVHDWKRRSAKDPKHFWRHLISTIRYFNKWGWKW